MARRGDRYRCSFCGKGRDQARRLIAGPGVYICDECVGLCNEIMAEAPPPRTYGPGEGGLPVAGGQVTSWWRRLMRRGLPSERGVRLQMTRHAPAAGTGSSRT